MDTLGHEINEASEISCIETLVYWYTALIVTGKLIKCS